MLTCRSCGRQLAAGEFHRRKSSKTGRVSCCRECANAAARKRRLAARAADYPVSFDFLCILADRLPAQERRALWEHLRPSALAGQLFRDAFDNDVRAVLSDGGGMRMLSL